MSRAENTWAEQLRELRMEQLRKDIQAGIESGPSSSLDFDDIKQRGPARLKSKKQDLRP